VAEYAKEADMPFNSRNQDVTYWTPNGLSDDGFPAFNTPITVKGRWEDRTVLIASQQGGETLSSNARVFLDIKLPSSTEMILGVSVAATPPDTTRKVIRVVDIPSIDGRKSEKGHFLD